MPAGVISPYYSRRRFRGFIRFLARREERAKAPAARRSAEDMNSADYDNPEIEERWCKQQRTIVQEYLRAQGLKHGRIGERPAWLVAPYVSIWAIESVARPEWIGWWVICGDLPTDYILAVNVEPPQHPRKAIRVIAERWLHQAEMWKQDQECEDSRIAGTHSHQELAPLLGTRAELLLKWTEDDSLWEDG